METFEEDECPTFNEYRKIVDELTDKTNENLFANFSRCTSMISFPFCENNKDNITGEPTNQNEILDDCVPFRKWYFKMFGGEYSILKRNMVISTLFKAWFLLRENTISLNFKQLSITSVDGSGIKIKLRRSNGQIQTGWLEHKTQLKFNESKRKVYIRVVFLDKENLKLYNSDIDITEYEYVNGYVKCNNINDERILNMNIVTKFIPLHEFVKLNSDLIINADIEMLYMNNELMVGYNGYEYEKTYNTLDILANLQKRQLDMFKMCCKKHGINETFWETIREVPTENNREIP